MSLQDIASKLTDKLQAQVCSAGIWKYDENHKKVPKRVTTYPSKWIEGTNLLQVFLTKDTPLVCIDADGIALDELEELYPSIVSTFTTQTTRSDKRHFWFKRSEQLPITRMKMAQYDIISSGFMFEGHSIPGQEAEWQIVNDAPLQELTQEEIDYIVSHRPEASKRIGSANHSMFIDAAMHAGVKLAIKNGRIDAPSVKEKDALMKKKEWKKLALSLMNEQDRSAQKASKARIELPELSYMTFNTIAYKLSYNALIAHEDRDKFLELLISDYYGKALNSVATRTALAQMLCNLPRHESMEDRLAESESLQTDMEHTIINGYGLIKYIDNRNIYFMEINMSTMKPRRAGKNDDPSLSLQTLAQLRGLSKEDVAGIPQVKILTDPFGPRVSYCDDSDIDTLNLAEHSTYYERALPVSKLPDNVVTRVITSYMGTGRDREFYLHWLAHAMFGKRAPQTVPMLVTDKMTEGATGKTTLAQAIPTRLITMSNTIEVSSTDSGYGDAMVGKRLSIFNDVPRLTTQQWQTLHGVIRDRTTAGARRQDNMKYGSFAVTSAALAFTWSSNWIPGIDEHDRRLWYALPHNVAPYGKQPRLSDEDSRALNLLFENSSIEHHSDELQDLANHLLHLYKNEKTKYYHELFTEAPHTVGRDIALKSDKNYSEQILSSIKEGPESLVDILGIDEFIINSLKFIAFQYQPQGQYITLPWEFLADLLYQLHGSDSEKKHKKAQVASALQLDTKAFCNQSASTTKYKDRQLLVKAGIDPDIADYSQQQLKLPMSDTVYSKYINYLKEIQ